MSDLFDKGRYFNRTLFLSVFLIAVSSFTYGFDNQAFATTQAMEYSTKQFGEYDTVKRNYVLPPSWLSLFNSLNHTGFAAVPAPVRGFVVGTYQLSLVVGGLPINSICYGTSKIDDNRSWRIPLGLFYIVPSIVAALIFLVPESPRWLLRQNRPEEAKAMLVRLRQGAFTTEEVEAEFLELRLALESEEKGKFVEGPYFEVSTPQPSNDVQQELTAARYTKRVRRGCSSPADSTDEATVLHKELDDFAEALPDDLKLTSERLLYMSHSDEASEYIALHTIWLQCYCDLYRFLIA
ncbi:Hexose transporter HXT13 like protein [Verticillium longisporum]|uniref:Hexose transporter HXT13 like protein n=1 Tax=Verticillium longisporum TaxID=100787 RepID=A0A8I3AI16_VERLO|nr:Hexose transporter HXT13 like protein [Verticillium longisporum]